MNKKEISKLFKIIANTVDSLDENQIYLLLSGDGELAFNLKKINNRNELDSSIIEGIVSELDACKDRESAKSALERIQSKDILAKISKSLNLYITKNDKREQIEDKIIERIVGSKLRTQAIEGVQLNLNE